MMTSQTIRTSRLRGLWRLAELVFYFFYFMISASLERVFVREVATRQARRAVRLRQILETLGGAMVKIGQQLSLRLDVLPAVYCDELESLLDYTPSFPVEQAIRMIEQQTGKPLSATFEVFDPEPIGSASIACVYQAVLTNGDHVVVKVRRPGIEKVFAADLTALDWLMRVLEFITVIRPGISANFRSELRQMLLEELDFHLEVRYQEIFRRYFKKRKKYRITAPKVYYGLSGNNVIVSELVTGFWMTDILSAIERRDEKNLTYLRSLDIDPKTIAKNLIRSSFYSFFECPFFHGDPHPANILIQPHNKIVMVDFGACGVFSEKERNILRKMHHYYAKEDVGGMVQSVIHLIGPLPSIDVYAFTKELEDAWWQASYGLESKHSEWWEHTSFRLWISLLQLVRKYQIPMPLHMIRMIRATLLYDTVAARLHRKINVFKEYQKYYKSIAKRTRKQVQKAIVRQLLLGPDDIQYVRFQRFKELEDIFLFRAEEFLEQLPPNPAAVANKIFYFISTSVRWFKSFATTTFIAIVIIGLTKYMNNLAQSLNIKTAYENFRFNEAYQFDFSDPTSNMPVLVIGIIWAVFIFITTLLHGRQVLFRFEDKDVK